MMEEILQWRTDHELGIEEFDRQHHFFVNLINRLIQVILETDDISYRASLIDELRAYAKFHFISEENLMQRAQYPLLKHHQQEHEKLLKALDKQQENLKRSINNHDLKETIDYLVKWFLNHTQTDDKQFADFILSKE